MPNLNGRAVALPAFKRWARDLSGDDAAWLLEEWIPKRERAVADPRVLVAAARRRPGVAATPRSRWRAAPRRARFLRCYNCGWSGGPGEVTDVYPKYRGPIRDCWPNRSRAL